MLMKYPAHRYTVYAKKEIILSAGAIGSPHLLMLSGIGNATALSEHGIKALIDSPDVGRHLQDHPYLQTYFEVNTTSTVLDSLSRDPSVTQKHMEEWKEQRKGVFSGTNWNTLAFLRMRDNELVSEDMKDPAAGTCSGNLLQNHLYRALAFQVSKRATSSSSSWLVLDARLTWDLLIPILLLS